MREKSVETHLHDEVKLRGGFCLKLNPNWNKGVPDRLVVLPGKIAFVELKRPKGGVLSTLQKWWENRLTALVPGSHYVLRTKAQIDDFLRNYSVEKYHACEDDRRR